MADRPGVAGPLDGVRVLALEQMQALRYGTQVLARLGAEVVLREELGLSDAELDALRAAQVISDEDGSVLPPAFTVGTH